MNTHDNYFHRSQDQLTHIVSTKRTQTKGAEIFTIRLCETMQSDVDSSRFAMADGHFRFRRAPESQTDLFFEIWDFTDAPRDDVDTKS